jgi:hypothetical protein
MNHYTKLIGGGIAPSNLIIGSLLRTPGRQASCENDLHIVQMDSTNTQLMIHYTRLVGGGIPPSLRTPGWQANWENDLRIAPIESKTPNLMNDRLKFNGTWRK